MTNAGMGHYDSWVILTHRISQVCLLLKADRSITVPFVSDTTMQVGSLSWWPVRFYENPPKAWEDHPCAV